MRAVPAYVARVLGRLAGLTETPTGWTSFCPCPGHGADGADSTPSLRVTVGEEGKLLLSCRVGCPFESVLLALGLMPRDLFPSPGEPPCPALAPEAHELSEEDADHRNHVYSLVLACLGLSAEHRKSLKARGLDAHEIEHGGYRTLAYAAMPLFLRELSSRLGPEYAVPGLRFDDGFALTGPYAGLVIPVRDHRGRTVALKTRKEGTPKYLYWSSKDDPSGAPVHFPPCGPFGPLGVVRLTEGEFKAHVATKLSGVYSLGVPGFGNWPKAMPCLKRLGPAKVLVSFDWPDVLKKPEVCRQLLLCLAALKDRGFLPGVETWDPKHKGVDDALAAGAKTHAHWGADAHKKLEDEVPGVAALSKDRLRYDLPDAPPFPLDALPYAVGKFCEVEAERLQVPPDYLAVCCLAAAARAVGNTVAIQLEEGYKEVPNLYAVFVGPASKLKTPCMDRALAPINEVQEAEAEAFKARTKSFRKAKDSWKELPWRDRERVGLPSSPDPPWHLFTTECTTETLFWMIEANGDHERADTSILIKADELLAWFNSFDKYRGGKGNDRQLYLSGWSRTNYKKDLKSSGESLFIKEPCISVLGATQPDRLPELENRKGAEDGFLPRFLFSFPEAGGEYRPDDGFVYDSRYFRAWRVFVLRLLALTGRRTLHMGPEAFALWKKYLHLHADEAEADDFESKLEPFWGKLRGYFGRLVALVRCLRVACGEVGGLCSSSGSSSPSRREIVAFGSVDPDDVSRAWKLLAYFKAHLRKVLKTMPLGAPERRILEFAEWVRKVHGGTVTPRCVYHQKHFGCRGKEDALKLFKEAEDRGFGELVLASTTRAGKKVPTVFVLTKERGDD